MCNGRIHPSGSGCGDKFVVHNGTSKIAQTRHIAGVGALA